MPDMSILKKYAGILGRGLVLELTPRMARGFINELFHHWKVNPDKITQDVFDDRSWEMEPAQLEYLRALEQRVGNLNFITPELVIDSIKVDFPEVARLFLEWPPAGEWLSRQVEGIKRQVNGESP